MSEPPPMSKEDARELALFKKQISREYAFDVTQDEPSYLREFNVYAVHRMDPRTATTVVNSYYFHSKDVAKLAITHAKTLRGL